MIFFIRELGGWIHRNGFCHRLKKTDDMLSTFGGENSGASLPG
jgi:hypothetical protein